MRGSGSEEKCGEKPSLSKSSDSSFWKNVLGRRRSPRRSVEDDSLDAIRSEEATLNPFLLAGMRAGLVVDPRRLSSSSSLFPQKKTLFRFCSNTGADEVIMTQSVSTKSVVVEISGCTISTYPMSKSNGLREGSPVCDSFGIEVLSDDRVTLCVADGCGWGENSFLASGRASVALLDNLRDAKHHETELLHALASAHNSIMETRISGTTTILGGIIAPGESAASFRFLFVSVGDCKAYCRNGETGEVVDLNVVTRMSEQDAKDPGGRIGPFGKKGEPDLRNFFIGSVNMNIGDMILLMSDGVADNFDAEFNGSLPSDHGTSEASWKDVPDVEKFKSKLCCSKMTELLRNVSSCKSVAQTVLSFCKELTINSREFLETSDKKLPSDYTKYPGKMDHATCLCVRMMQK
jgi:serine/threonine protein phosphatase PrpC